MSRVSLPPLHLNFNTVRCQPFVGQPTRTARKAKPAFSTDQLSLLLSLCAIGVYQTAQAQQTEAELIITAQNNFGDVTQLILSEGKLYILTGGCELQFVRLATAADLAAINSLSPLSLDEVGLDLFLISTAQMDAADVSDYCLNSDPISEFVDQIRQSDDSAVSMTGMLVAGLGLLAGLGGGFGGGGGGGSGTQASDQSSLSVTASDQSDDAVVSVKKDATDKPYLELAEGRYDDDEDSLATLSATGRTGTPVTNLAVSDNRWFEIRENNELFIKEDAEFDFEDEALIELTVTGDNGGFEQTLNVVITDKDEFPASLSLNTDEGVADNTKTSTQRTLATVTVDEGKDTGTGGQLEITAATPTIPGMTKAKAEELVEKAEALVELAGTTLRLKAGISPEDMPAGEYKYTISYVAGGDDLIGTPPPPVTFTLRVGDINEQPTGIAVTTDDAHLFESEDDNNAASIYENTAIPEEGIKLATLAVEDDDENQVFRNNILSVPEEDPHFEIKDGNELWLKAGVVLDHEANESLSVEITAKDNGAELGQPATQTFTLHIQDVDEQPIGFSAPKSTDVAENRSGETEIKLADISIIDPDSGSDFRDNTVRISGVVDQIGNPIVDEDGKPVTNFATLFALREDGTQLWLTDPSVLDFEEVEQYRFTLSLTANGSAVAGLEDISFTLKVADTVLNADETHNLSLAELQRDGFNTQVSDPNDETVSDQHFSLTDHTEGQIFELVTDSNNDDIESVKLKDDAADTLTAGTYTATVTVVHNEITVALDDKDLKGAPLQSLDDETSTLTLPDTAQIQGKTITIQIGKDKFIVLKKAADNTYAFDAVTQAEIGTLTENEFVLLARLNDDGTITEQQKIEEQDIFSPPRTEQQQITLIVSHAPVDAQATAAADDFLGHADHIDSVSYADAEAQPKGGDQFGVKVDLNITDDVQPATYNDPLGATDISNGWAAGDRLANIENLIGTAYRDHLIGNESDNQLNGNRGDDILDGGAGDDVIIGGPGADVIKGGAGTDTASYAGTSAAAARTVGDVSGLTGIVADLSKQGTFSFADGVTGLTGAPVTVTPGTDAYIILKADGRFEAVGKTELSGLGVGSYIIVARLNSAGSAALQESYDSQPFFDTPTTEIGIGLAAAALNNDTVTGVRLDWTGPAQLTTDDIGVSVGTDSFIVLKTDGSFEAVSQTELDALRYDQAVIVAKLDDTGTITDQLQHNSQNYFSGSAATLTVNLEADALNGQPLQGLATQTDGPANLPTTPVTAEVGMDSFIVLKTDGTLEAFTQAELDALRYGEAVIVAKLDANGAITDMAQDNGTDFFTQGAITYSYALNGNLEVADLLSNGLPDKAVTSSDGDILTGIENLIGSRYNDLLTGDNNDNDLRGGGGDDRLVGGAGLDTLRGGAGRDKFQIELADGARAADLITDFTLADDKLLLDMPDMPDGSDAQYDNLAALLDAASLRLEAGTAGTDDENDLKLVYRQENAPDEVVLVLDDFLNGNNLDALMLTHFELI